MKTVYLEHDDVMRAARSLVRCFPVGTFPTRIYGVPRGGIPVAYLLAGIANVEICSNPTDAQVIVDDVMDSGSTREKYKDKPFFALFGPADFRVTQNPGYLNTVVGEIKSGWLVFPWEQTSVGSGEDICTRLLQYIGENPNRGGLLETPKRFLKAWKHWTSGYQENPAELLKTFEDGAEGCDELILVKDIPIYSHCEHHLAAIFGHAHIGYIPNGKIVGLSKLARLADMYARRLQVQERLTNQIADALDQNLKPQGVAVVVEARHFCMESRGVQKMGSATTTSAMRGVFRKETAARAEFMSLIR